MTTSISGEVEIKIAGSYSGIFTIDWGDGSEMETHTLLEYDNYFGGHCPLNCVNVNTGFNSSALLFTNFKI